MTEHAAAKASGRSSEGLPRCPVCDATRSRSRFSVRTTSVFTFHECASCGLAFAWPRPSAAELAELYGADYFANEAGFGYADYAIGKVNAERMWTNVSIWSSRPFDSDHRRMLDIGCASGEFAASAARHGWEAWGCEPSPLADSAREKGVRVVSELTDDALPVRDFGLVTAFDVIEHLLDPMDLLRHSRRLVAEDGLLLVETANWDSLGRRLKGPRWAQVSPPEHINFFDGGSLVRALQVAGFDPLIVDTPHGGAINRAIQALHRGWPLRAARNLAIAHGLSRTRLGGNLRVLAAPKPENGGKRP